MMKDDRKKASKQGQIFNTGPLESVLSGAALPSIRTRAQILSGERWATGSDA